MMWEIDKRDVLRWLKNLKRDFDVIAPVDVHGEALFMPLSDDTEVTLDYTNTLESPKEFFLPKTDEMFSFRKKGEDFEITSKIDDKKRIIFGIRPCDVNALTILDKVFGGEYRDPYYFSRRKNTTIVAMTCTKPGINCFCDSMGTGPSLSKDFDLLFTELNDTYLVEVGTKKGEEILKSKKGFFKEADEIKRDEKEKKIEAAKKRIKRHIDPFEISRKLKCVDDEVWRKLGERCIGCGGCSYVCPTCHCFDVRDISVGESGRRLRYWDSCIFSGFTRMAGGVNPRETKESRMKQRYNCKFNYFFERYGMFGCVGCGRCTDVCPGNIKMVEFLKELKAVILTGNGKDRKKMKKR
jgi:ferredoxin